MLCKKLTVFFLCVLPVCFFSACSLLEELPIEITQNEDGTYVIEPGEDWDEYFGTGDSSSADNAPAASADSASADEPPPAEEAHPQYTVSFDPDEDFPNEAVRRAAQLIDPAIAGAVQLLNTLPAQAPFEVLYREQPEPLQRDRLTDPLSLEVYDTVLAAVSSYGDYYYNELDYGEDFFGRYVAGIDALKFDHPELFTYFDGAFDGYDYYPGYFMPGDWLDEPCDDREAIRTEMQVYEGVVQRILQKMPTGLDNYRKCAYFAFVIALHCSYNHAQDDFADLQAYHALVPGQAVCQGYAQALKVLCDAAGIHCQYDSGTAPSGGLHAWNRIETADGPAYMDVTWFDTDEPMEDYWDGKYYYLFMTQQEFDDYGYVSVPISYIWS